MLKNTLPILITISLFAIACGQDNTSSKIKEIARENNSTQKQKIHPNGKTLDQRLTPPEGFQRIAVDTTSFAFYLRNLPLKPHGAKVLYYDGQVKPNTGIYDAVIDLPIGKRNLHQCADAVMRLRAEYLYEQKNYDAIHFNFTNGFKVAYSEWSKGKRIRVEGNKVRWTQGSNTTSHNRQSFWKYMELIFSYAGTASLEKELESVQFKDLNAGDVLIQGGFPGHAVIIVDIAIHPITQKKVFLLAQSYMPAQEIQILKNPQNPLLSPWYLPEEGVELETPEWLFKKTDLKRFKDL